MSDSAGDVLRLVLGVQLLVGPAEGGPPRLRAVPSFAGIRPP
jgi:hypothetical protein